MAYEVEILSSLNPVPDDLNVNLINVRSLSATTLTANGAYFRSITSLTAVTQVNASTSGDFTVNGNLNVLSNIIASGGMSANSGYFPNLIVNSLTARLNISGQNIFVQALSAQSITGHTLSAQFGNINSITALGSISAGTISGGSAKFTNLSASNAIFNALSTNVLVYNSITSIEIVTTGSLNIQGSLDVTASPLNTFIAKFVDSNSANKFIIENTSGNVSSTGDMNIFGGLTASGSAQINGRLGVGTNNTYPKAKLQLHSNVPGNSFLSSGILISNTGSNNNPGEPSISFQNDSITSGDNFWTIGLNQSSTISFSYGADFLGANTKQVITPGGLLGVGTTNPLTHLHVTGSISAQTLTGSVISGQNIFVQALSAQSITAFSLSSQSITALGSISAGTLSAGESRIKMLGVNTAPDATYPIIVNGSSRITNGNFSMQNPGAGGLILLDCEFETNCSGLYSPDGDQIIIDFNYVSNKYRLGNGGIIINDGASIIALNNALTSGYSISAASISTGSIATTNVVVNNTLYANEIAAAVKHFVIPHPLKKGNVLVHGSLEGPENGVFYRGSTKLNNGISTIRLPDYFNKLVHQESITIYLQTMNEHENIFVKNIDYENNEFIVMYRKKKFIEKIITGKNKDIEFNWLVIAERKDTPKLRIEK